MAVQNPTPAPDPQTARLLAAMDETGWGGMVIRRRAEQRFGYALARLGVVSSMDIEPGQDEWKLNLTRAGNALRRALIAQEAATDA